MSAARAAFLGVRRIYRKDTVRIGFEMSTAPTSSVGWKRTWIMFVVDRAGSNAFSRPESGTKFLRVQILVNSLLSSARQRYRGSDPSRRLHIRRLL